MTTVALCVITHDRPLEVREALRSAELEDWDEVRVLDNASQPPVEPVPGTTWIRSDSNLGVTAGRNRLAEGASSDVLVFLDDDAAFITPVVEPLRVRFDADPSLAVASFRVVRRDGRVVSSEHPFRGPARAEDVERECAYFLGGAHAVRRSALREVVGYDESFFYSTEEVDLAYRLLGRGWRLRYVPEITVEHRPSETGRSLRPAVPAMRMRNRIILARRHLPAPIAAVHVAVWTARTFREALAAKAVRTWATGWVTGARTPVDRRPLGWRHLARIHHLGGRVLW